MLAGLGYEVFTPKRYPLVHRSASSTYEWDSTLTIPPEDLELLNGFDFYNARLDPHIRDILNRHFGVAIVSYYTEKLDRLLFGFEGHVVLRAFGLPVGAFSYFSFADVTLTPGFRQRLLAAQDRFWFGQVYPNLLEIEPEFVRRRAVTLPLGLPRKFWAQQGTWTGTRRQILFICPDIKTYHINEADYRVFKEVFGDLPHVIGGRQHEPVGDPAVVGMIPRSAYDALLRESAVMFYPSREPRHLHYHPLEAVCFGMPLVFMRQGLLGRLGGRDLPGACDTVAEARSKVERILDGDRSFREEVRASQQVLLDAFRDEPAREAWGAWLASLPPRPDPTVRRQYRVAVLVGPDQPEDVRRVALHLAGTLLDGARDSGEELQVVLGLPQDLADYGRLATADDPRIEVRPMEWRPMQASDVSVAQDLSGHLSTVIEAEHRVPFDGAASFQDCDLWLVVAAHLEHAVAPVHRFGLVLTDSRDWQPGAKPARGDRRALISAARTAEGVLSSSETVLGHARQAFGLAEAWYAAIRLPARPEAEPGEAKAKWPLALAVENSSRKGVLRAMLRGAAKADAGREGTAIGLLDEAWSDEEEGELLELLAREATLSPYSRATGIEVERVSSLTELARRTRMLVLPGRVAHVAELFRTAAEQGCAVIFPEDPFLERVAGAEGARFATFAPASAGRIADALRKATPVQPEGGPNGLGGDPPAAIWRQVRRLL